MQLQLASFWKRISAWLFDFILLGVFAILFAFALSGTLGYTTHSNAMEAAYNKYETQYGITFDITDALADEIAANLETLVGTTEEEAPKVEPRHPVSDTTTKFANLQFGRNYDIKNT